MNGRRGFTLLEVVIVLALIGLLGGIALVGVSRGGTRAAQDEAVRAIERRLLEARVDAMQRTRVNAVRAEFRADGLVLSGSGREERIEGPEMVSIDERAREVEALEVAYADNPQERKRLLAEELTIRIHGREAYHAVLKVSDLLFGRQSGREALLQLSATELEAVAREIPAHQLPAESLSAGINILDLLAGQTSILASKGEARKAIQNHAISINKLKIDTHEAVIGIGDLLHGRFLMVENGKKNKYILIAV